MTAMPDLPQIDALRAQFERDLARRPRRDGAARVRDRYLGRKDRLVSALMKALGARAAGGAAALGQLANELKQQIEARWTSASSAAAATRRRPARSTSRCPAARRALGHRHPLTLVRERIEAIFTAHGLPRSSKGPSSRTTTTTSKRSTCRRSIPRATCRTRCISRRRCRSPAGRRRDAAAHAHLGDADPLHGDASAAGPDHRAGPRLSPRQPRPDAHADVHAGRRAGRRRGHLARRI